MGISLGEALRVIGLQTAAGELLLCRVVLALLIPLAFQRLARWLLPLLGIGLTLTVPAQRPVLLTLTNQGTVEHTFVVSGLIHQMIERNHDHGTDALITFV